MSIFDKVIESLEAWPKPRQDGRQIVIPTFSLYPSSSIIELHIEGGAESVVVSDGGGAFDEIDGSGEYTFDAFRVMAAVVKKQGFSVNKNGWICSPRIPYSELPTIIACTATISKDASDHLLNRFKPNKKRDYRFELKKQLLLRFNDNVRTKVKLVGASNKPHIFDFSIPIASGGKLIIDAVTRDANSINSAVVSHLDLAHAEQEKIQQRIIYDDGDEWNSSDLSLLSVGAKTVSFSQAQAVIGKIAA